MTMRLCRARDKQVGAYVRLASCVKVGWQSIDMEASTDIYMSTIAPPRCGARIVLSYLKMERHSMLSVVIYISCCKLIHTSAHSWVSPIAARLQRVCQHRCGHGAIGLPRHTHQDERKVSSVHWWHGLRPTIDKDDNVGTGDELQGLQSSCLNSPCACKRSYLQVLVTKHKDRQTTTLHCTDGWIDGAHIPLILLGSTSSDCPYMRALHWRCAATWDERSNAAKKCTGTSQIKLGGCAAGHCHYNSF